uniref:Uncharacterized protein n=1 Tax=Romanomermis culicivorax TaxID=13658 RepID=A0A915I4Z2_ROMCU
MTQHFGEWNKQLEQFMALQEHTIMCDLTNINNELKSFSLTFDYTDYVNLAYANLAYVNLRQFGVCQFG